MSQRVSPLAQVRDCGNLLTRAGMKLPAVDVDTLTMQYPSPMKLVEHLRSMAETNAAVSRRRGAARRSTAAAAAACYSHMFPAANPERADAVECTFQVLYMTGWSPGEPAGAAREGQRGRQPGEARGGAGEGTVTHDRERAQR